MEKYIIWDSNPDFEDWKDDLREEYPDVSEDELRRIMYETNNEYLDDEKENCKGISLPNGICAVADLGLWYGRRSGITELQFDSVSDCFRSFVHGQSDLCIYVDEEGELRIREDHHDGTNYYWFRAWKPDVTQEQKDSLQDMVYSQQEYEKILRQLTYRLGDLIGDVYGWNFADQPKYTLKSTA